MLQFESDPRDYKLTRWTDLHDCLKKQVLQLGFALSRLWSLSCMIIWNEIPIYLLHAYLPGCWQRRNLLMITKQCTYHLGLNRIALYRICMLLRLHRLCGLLFLLLHLVCCLMLDHSCKMPVGRTWGALSCKSFNSLVLRDEVATGTKCYIVTAVRCCRNEGLLASLLLFVCICHLVKLAECNYIVVTRKRSRVARRYWSIFVSASLIVVCLRWTIRVHHIRLGL